MKNNEPRFVKKKKRKIVNPKDHRIKHLKLTSEKKSLDCFIDQDGIFDSGFSRDDFLKLTKKWKEKNLEN